MINPIVLILTGALFLSMLAVCIINRPKKPLVTAAMIMILFFYVTATFFLDNAIISIRAGYEPNEFIRFLTSDEVQNYESLTASFHTYMVMDISIIIAAVISMFAEIMLIFRKNSI